MDPELVVLADTAATTVVAAMATDAWAGARSAVAGLWRRVDPARTEGVEADLADARAQALTAGETGDEWAEQMLVGEWRARLTRLLVVDPDLADDLRGMVTELAAALPDADRVRIGRIEMTGTASDRARIVQLGQGTQNVTGL